MGVIDEAFGDLGTIRVVSKWCQMALVLVPRLFHFLPIRLTYAEC